MTSFPRYDRQKMDEIFQFTQKSGAEVIRLKGGAGYAVGVAIREVVNAIALNKGAILPVSSLQKGALGIQDVCFSLPTRLSRSGVEEVIEIHLSTEEREALQHSAGVLKETLKQVMG
jgi:L-lactate dehydrogenase